MKPKIQPYLFFGGLCEKALVYYTRAIGAEVKALMRYKDNPEPDEEKFKIPKGYEDKVMHACMRVGNAYIMASDGCGEEAEHKGYSIYLGCENAAEAEERFNALADKGKVNMPLEKTFWSPKFGMVTDPFGIQWMVGVDVD
ncbi:PhnB protein [Rubritalea squalenifaciens DSM 18772]|uniref:PhnB protein n=2 Tax=Rubritalea TaxID=361050 RepID=A0A1M6B9Y3_9BACT|nr:VOC family protein [Rubritalea squalenifaciens]SHI45522.1 PhnB protein [Rubritalea squalenifaciens DSM 18772]